MENIMSTKNLNANAVAKALIAAVTLSAAALAGQAHAAGPKDSAFSGDRYGYVFRANESRSAYTDGAKAARFDPYTDGAKAGKFDPYSDGARVSKKGPYIDGFGTLAGLDRAGVSSAPARSKFDPYADGAKAGKFDPFTDGALA